MITVYGYIPAWGLPCISPYVTKAVNYLTFAGLEHEVKAQDLTRLDEDSPNGKLPYIIDSDGTKVPDSQAIINYCKKKYGDPLDADMSASDKATALAFTRLVEEHVYWDGIIEPRWRRDSGFETYIPYIVGGAEVGPELRAMLDAFRQRVLDGFNGQGMGRRPSDIVVDLFKQDVDALSDFLADKPYFMGDKLRSVDATIYSSLRHVTDQPQQWEGTGYTATKPNLVEYMERIRKEHGV